MSERTGNCAIEVDLLQVSKAHRFLVAFKFANGWHGQVLHRLDIEKLLSRTKLTHAGRQWYYPRIPTGQVFPDGSRKVSALVPTADLLRYGEEVTTFIKRLQNDLAGNHRENQAA